MMQSRRPGRLADRPVDVRRRARLLYRGRIDDDADDIADDSRSTRAPHRNTAAANDDDTRLDLFTGGSRTPVDEDLGPGDPDPDPDVTEPGSSAGRTVFVAALVIVAAASVWALVAPQQMTATIRSVTRFAIESLDWLFLLLATGLLVLAVALALSRFGSIRLGADHERPEFSTVSWLSMLFAGGMGAGLVFWGVAEPLTHFRDPPGLEGSTPAAAREAMVVTNLHWGLHAWAIYGMSAMVIAYFAFRLGRRTLVSEPLRVVFPRRHETFFHVADVFAVIAVVFGLVGSLMQGTLQFRSGLASVFGTDQSSGLIGVLIMLALTAAFMLSASTGVDKGIRILSNMNITVTVLLMFFVMFFGPTRYVLETFVTTIGDYVNRLTEISFRLYPYEGLTDWTATWTLNYFLWWLAWGPFVGIFIARISRGRTIREFVLGVVVAPSVFSLLWFATFGGAGLHNELEGRGGLGSLVDDDVSAALFGFLDLLPGAEVIGLVTLFLLFVFLVTSADSGTYVLGLMTSDGDINPSVARKLTWGAIIAVLTTLVLLVGDVDVARAMAVTGAIPFTLVLILQLGAFLHTIRYDSALHTVELHPADDRPTVDTVGPVGTDDPGSRDRT